jgi:putative transcriptional regulator
MQSTFPAAKKAAGERNSFRPNKQSLRKKVFPIVRMGNIKTRMRTTTPAPTKPSARRGRPDGNQASHRETGFAPGETAKAAEEKFLAPPSEAPIKLDDLLHDRRMTLTKLADRIGMTLANLSILKTGKARAIRFSTLNAICGALSCQPGDILRF